MIDPVAVGSTGQVDTEDPSATSTPDSGGPSPAPSGADAPGDVAPSSDEPRIETAVMAVHQAAVSPTIEEMKLRDIKRDRFQLRVEDGSLTEVEAHASRLVECENLDSLPKPVVSKSDNPDLDGHLLSGHARCRACEKQGRETIAVHRVFVRTDLEALAVAVAENVCHGLRLTDEDRRHQASILEKAGMPRVEIARVFGVTPGTITKWLGRADPVPSVSAEERDRVLRNRALKLTDIAAQLGISTSAACKARKKLFAVVELPAANPQPVELPVEVDRDGGPERGNAPASSPRPQPTESGHAVECEATETISQICGKAVPSETGAQQSPFPTSRADVPGPKGDLLRQCDEFKRYLAQVDVAALNLADQSVTAQIKHIVGGLERLARSINDNRVRAVVVTTNVQLSAGSNVEEKVALEAAA